MRIAGVRYLRRRAEYFGAAATLKGLSMRFPRSRRMLAALALATALPAHASLFSGDALDAVANGIAWVVILIVPVIAIAVFWIVHVMPE